MSLKGLTLNCDVVELLPGSGVWGEGSDDLDEHSPLAVLGGGTEGWAVSTIKGLA
jgi:hypothetical protein